MALSYNPADPYERISPWTAVGPVGGMHASDQRGMQPSSSVKGCRLKSTARADHNVKRGVRPSTGATHDAAHNRPKQAPSLEQKRRNAARAQRKADRQKITGRNTAVKFTSPTHRPLRAAIY